jgi:DEAD/DEAH box helicase domain-containing protein
MAIGKSDGASNSLPADWHLVHTISIDPRAAQRIAPRGIPLAPAAEQYLRRNFPAGIYEHQYYAVEQLVAGKHVCLATSTASGKTLAFTTAAIDHLAKTTEARVLAIYPQRSLGNEQERRWQIALHSAGVKAQVGRIDGSVASSTRSEVLRR